MRFVLIGGSQDGQEWDLVGVELAPYVHHRPPDGGGPGGRSFQRCERRAVTPEWAAKGVGLMFVYTGEVSDPSSP